VPAAEAPRCPPSAEAPLSDVPEGLKPGRSLEADVLEKQGYRENPLKTFETAFKEQLKVAGDVLDVQGFLERDDPRQRAAVVVMKKAADGGSCVLNAWLSGEHLLQLRLVSMWRAKDGKRALVLVEASGAHAPGGKAKSLVLGADSQRVWKVYETDAVGLAFDPQGATLVVLGAGAPLSLTDDWQLQARAAPGPAEGPQTCPKSGSRPLDEGRASAADADENLKRDQWVAADAPEQLYDLWKDDDQAHVAFRKQLAVGGRDVEVVGIAGQNASLVFLSRAPKGFCVLGVRYWSFGGNGVEFRPTWWTSPDKKVAVLLAQVTLNYHHGAGPEDARSKDEEVAIAIDERGVRPASPAEEARASAARKRH
jgi:hypothetical protein